MAFVQAPVQNWTDTRLHRFYRDVQGKSEENFLLQLAGGHGNHQETRERIQQSDTRPRQERNGAAAHRQVCEKGGVD